ncbi:MAG: 2-hydroxyacid dehydrogenase [Geminicoccaceae bacterium]
MALLFLSEADPVDDWRDALLAEIPDLDFRVWPDQVGDPDEIDLALVWRPPAGELKRYPNLKAILSLGAGIDAMLQDQTLPDLPLARMVDPSLTRNMADYILLAALRHHREFDLFEREQRRSNWAFTFPKGVEDRRVGVMGQGVLGKAASLALHQQGFDVAGWSRSSKSIKGIETYHGTGQIDAFLTRTEILVCLLPLTDETEGILSSSLFKKLPKGAYLINAARGRHLMEEDLIDALDSGQLAGATLDVFENEPLPDHSPLWLHERILITPHVASYCLPKTAAKGVAENIRLARAGKTLQHQVNRSKGY